MTAPAAAGMFQPVAACWVCGGTTLTRFHECHFDFKLYAAQDPEIHEYDKTSVWLVKCAACGFAQPDALPTLPRFFDRMYDQRWSEDWVEREFVTRQHIPLRWRVAEAGARLLSPLL